MVLRLGLVGRGRWGRNIERTLASFSDVSVVPIPRRGCRPGAFDGVLVATPSATHAEVALPYIEAGIATFIEKPMATSVGDADRIRDAAARSGASVFVGHVFLYNPAFLTALRLLPELEPIRYLHCEGANNNPRADSSVLWDWLPHDLSMARKIFDRDASVVKAWKLLGQVRAEVAVSIFQFGDVSVVSTMSWHSSVRARKATIVCEKATLVFDDRADRRLALYGKNGKVSYPSYSDEPPLTREIEAFLQTVRSKRMDAPHLEIGLGVVRAIAAAERSIEADGQTVRIR
jgi:predicted dehydrogenase